MQININLILDDLKIGKSQRTIDSLDKLNMLLASRFKESKQDYSIATIGRLSKAENGIGTVSIRNKSGEHYRLLIDAWATKANTTMKKPPAPHSRKNDIPSDMELLKHLDDPALRAVFGQIIAEKNKLKVENRILKQNAEVIIDLRPNHVVQAKQATQDVQVLSSLNSILCNSEIEALKDSIDENRIMQRGWTISELGAVKDENHRPVFKVGFVQAIQKVLTQT